MTKSHAMGEAFVRGSIPRGEREPYDLHQTPAVGTKMLLAAESFPGPVWEPACGKGAISEVLKAHKFKVHSTDLIDWGYGESGVDFLTCRPPRFKFRSIITNPPFHKKAPIEFCWRALSFHPDKVAMLGRLAWMEGKSKMELLKNSGLTRVYVFSSIRLNMPRESERHNFPSETGGMVAYAWYVWHKGHKGPPEVHFL